MRQLFFKRSLESGARVEAVDERFHHLVRVLDFGAGDSLVAADADGKRFEAVVESIAESSALIKIGKVLPPLPPEPFLRLAVAPPKGKAFDQVLDIAAQLGVREIQPVFTQRTVVRWDEKTWKAKVPRFEKILEEAAAQCNRPMPARLLEPQDFDKSLKMQTGKQILAWEVSDEKAEAALDKLIAEQPEKITMWIGPEGGFDLEEAKKILAGGAHEISLGPALLRVPVAVAALVTRVQAAWERKNLK